MGGTLSILQNTLLWYSAAMAQSDNRNGVSVHSLGRNPLILISLIFWTPYLSTDNPSTRAYPLCPLVFWLGQGLVDGTPLSTLMQQGPGLTTKGRLQTPHDASYWLSSVVHTFLTACMQAETAGSIHAFWNAIKQGYLQWAHTPTSAKGNHDQCNC
jgi:hypothetical protein